MSMRLLACVLSVVCAPLGAVENLLPNGAFARGDIQPEGWTRTHNVSALPGTVQVHRDTAVFVSAPAAMRVESVGGRVDGNVNVVVADVGGKTFTLSGSLRCSGLDIAAIAVLPRRPDNSFGTTFSVTAHNADRWQEFSTEFTIEPEFDRFLLLIIIKGEGKAWFDDLVLVAR